MSAGGGLRLQSLRSETGGDVVARKSSARNGLTHATHHPTIGHSKGPFVGGGERIIGWNFPAGWGVLIFETDVNDDVELIEAAREGDRSAYGRLVERYQDRLYNALVRVVGSAEDARDIAQDAFVQAWLKLDTFRGAAAFYTWLYRIAFNRAMSQQRRTRPTQSLEAAPEAAGVEPVDPGLGPETTSRHDRNG